MRSEVAEAIWLVADDLVLVAPCLTFVLYLDHTDAGGILDFYQRARDALGARLTHYSPGFGPRRLSPKADQAVRQALELRERRRNPWQRHHVEFRGARQGVAASSLLLSFVHRPPLPADSAQAQQFRRNWAALAAQGSTAGPPVSKLRVSVPTDHPLADPERFVAWVKDFWLVSSWEFHSGYAGYAVNDCDRGLRSSALSALQNGRLRELAQRFPGLDIESHSLGERTRYDARLMAERGRFVPLCKRANWLTLLSTTAVELLGGAARVRERLAPWPAIRLYPLEHGLLLQAGERPSVCAVNNPADAEAAALYRAVAGLIRPLRVEHLPAGGKGHGFEEAAMRSWWDAFEAAPE